MKLTGKIWCALLAAAVVFVLLGAGIATAFHGLTDPPVPAASQSADVPPASTSLPELPSSPAAPDTPAAPAAPAAPASPSTPAQGDIGLDGAKSAAPAQAGLSEDQVAWTDLEQDWEHGRFEYELEFWAGQVEYDYSIDGTTGGILKERWEDHSAAGTTSDAGAAAAKTAVLSHLGIDESQAAAMKADRELENGLVEYEIEFWVGQTEYEYTVTGDGRIVEYEWENH